jgi:hypothetical protein
MTKREVELKKKFNNKVQQIAAYQAMMRSGEITPDNWIFFRMHLCKLKEKRRKYAEQLTDIGKPPASKRSLYRLPHDNQFRLWNIS